MSIQRQQADPRTFDSEQFPRSRSLTTALLHRIFSGLESGHLVIDTPAGERLVIDGNQPGPQRRLTICSWRFLWRLVAGWDIGFAESYMAGEWSSPNLGGLLMLALCNSAFAEPLQPLRPPRLLRRLRHALNRNTRRGSRRNIADDLGNEFYAPSHRKSTLSASITAFIPAFALQRASPKLAANAKLSFPFAVILLICSLNNFHSPGWKKSAGEGEMFTDGRGFREQPIQRHQRGNRRKYRK
jgi:hypothetical protein